MRRMAAFVIVMIGLTGVARAQRVERINPPGLVATQTYSHVVKVGNLLFIAGQVGTDQSGAVVGSTMKAQAEQVLANLATALTSQGAGVANIAKITIFTTSIDEFRAPEVVALRAKFFGATVPASTLIQVQRLASPDYKLEIEAIAVVP